MNLIVEGRRIIMAFYDDKVIPILKKTSMEMEKTPLARYFKWDSPCQRGLSFKFCRILSIFWIM